MAKRGRKPKVEKLDWERLYAVEKTVEERVAEHHPHLKDAHILVVGKPKAGKRGDRRIITASKAVGPELATVLKDQQLGKPLLALKGMYSRSALARRFGLADGTVQAIHEGRTWKRRATA